MGAKPAAKGRGTAGHAMGGISRQWCESIGGQMGVAAAVDAGRTERVGGRSSDGSCCSNLGNCEMGMDIAQIRILRLRVELPCLKGPP